MAAHAALAGGAAVDVWRRGAAHPASAAVPDQPPAHAAVAATRSGPTLSAGATVADQPRAAAVAAGLSRQTVPAIAAVAVQQASRAACLTRPAIGAVTDERPAQQRLGRRVDGAQNTLLQALQRRCVGSLCVGIRTSRGTQGLHQPGMKRDRLGTSGLISLSVP